MPNVRCSIVRSISTLIVRLIPATKAHIAKLIRAATGHVVASFSPLDENPACWASFPIFEILLEVDVTWSAFMLRQLTLFAKFYSTFWALKLSFSCID